MPNKMIEVPVKFGWFNYDTGVLRLDWFDNVENYTTEQCRIIADFISKETKTVECVVSDEQFELEQKRPWSNI